MKYRVACTALIISASSLGAGYTTAADAVSEDPGTSGNTQHSSGPTQETAAPPPSSASSQSVPSTASAPSEQQPQPPAEPSVASDAAGTRVSSSPPSADDDQTGIATVVVTARRTAEDIQKVPVAITAFTDKDLQREQITTGQDLAGRVPSLVITSNGQGRNNETPSIRGQGAVFGGSPGVIMYYDEVPLPEDSWFNNQGGPGKFFDLANLEVLKGSQGTLFGRNTTGGALLLEPHKPDPFFSASLRTEGGNYEDKGLEGIINLPLIEDQLFVRAGAKIYNRNGYTTDWVTGEDYDSKGYRTFRLGVMWKPTDDIQNYLLSYYTHSADNGTSEVIESFDNKSYVYPNAPNSPVQVGCLVLLLAGSTDCGQSFIKAQQAHGVRSVHPGDPPSDLLDTQALIDTFSYKLTDQLTLRDIASYALYKHTFTWDMDGTTMKLQDLVTPATASSSNTSLYTDEIQLQGLARSNQLKYVTGIYYENLRPAQNLDGINLGGFGSPFPNVSNFNPTQVTTANNLGVTETVDAYSESHRSYGPYAQATYNLGDLYDSLNDLNLTTGARYSIDDEFGESIIGTYAFQHLLTPGNLNYARVKTEAPTYTVDVDYKVPTTLLYAKVSRGYKSGGYSAQAVNPATLTFKPEKVMNYEVGHKSDFRLGDTPVRINSALYFTQYADMQRTAAQAYISGVVPAFGSATYNAGKAEIMGFETEATVIPLAGLTITANYSLTYGKYLQYTQQYFSYYNLPLRDCNNTVLSNNMTVHLECMPMANIPRHQGSVTVRYDVPVPDSVGRVGASATFSYTDRTYQSSTLLPSWEPSDWLDPAGLLNASVDWNNIGGSTFGLRLFGTNLTDRTYRIADSDISTTFFFTSSIYNEPRMCGAELSYEWR